MIDHDPDHLDRNRTWEDQYLSLIEDILRNGDDRQDRTGTGTRAIFGKTLDIDLADGFPAMTTKKLAWKAVVSELLWFIEGSDDERRLAEILHGTRDPEKKTIWTQNAQADYWKPKAQFEGDLGRIYGVQWRHWQRFKVNKNTSYSSDGPEMYTTYQVSEVDQLQELITKLKTDPTDRRMIISAWNVGELDQMGLPPCHLFAQFFVSQDKNKPRRLSCSVYMRSVDTMLGLPFNIASYALLTHLLAWVTNCVPHRLIMNLGDTHIYQNHLDGAKTQLARTVGKPPFLLLSERVNEIEDFTMDDIVLLEYHPQEAIKLDMAV